MYSFLQKIGKIYNKTHIYFHLGLNEIFTEEIFQQLIKNLINIKRYYDYSIFPNKDID